MNYFDWFLIIVIIVFGIKSLLKGFIQEIIGILTLILSILLTIVLSPYVNQFLIEKGIGISFAKILSIVTTFIAFYLILLLLTSPIKRLLDNELDKSNFESVDKFLGFVLGLILGFIFVIIIILIYDLFIKNIDFKSLNNLVESSFSYKIYSKYLSDLKIIGNFLNKKTK
ncbi:MAG TPA: CvpA family protein [Exilispira sp.]|nr:CvpA family protein [Exilispira sp.]